MLLGLKPRLFDMTTPTSQMTGTVFLLTALGTFRSRNLSFREIFVTRNFRCQEKLAVARTREPVRVSLPERARVV